MRYLVDDFLHNFEFWGQAADNANQLNLDQLDEIGEELESIYNDAEVKLDDTTINDLFWHDFEWVCGLIGLKVDDRGDVVEDEETWARKIVESLWLSVVDIYFDGFWEENGIGCFDSSRDVLDAFSDYVDDHYEEHAKSVLEKKFPGISSEVCNDYVDDDNWDKCLSDESNISNFQVYLKENENGTGQK